VGPTVAGVWRWDGESRSAAAEGRATDRGGWGLLIWYTPGFSREHGFSREYGKNGKNGKRSKTKLVTEGRLGDRPNGKSQYKSDFGSSWNFWDFGQMWRVGISQNLGEESDFAKSHLPGGYMLPP